ncbi:hypothetical protein A3770_20p85580 [Chloropicon primus]|uniref:Uncharacterized protein n=1 Tax=Chloropicon primus TaxID=1764295 RepID=A0A5B8N2E7_9CHLO|nr:hypothetical protein A3770_20p85580 [Chloropicon primus]|eukprot:QDZ26040.1 hypothetical protein A3770_20p85580 [Chloropicon primus]
MQSDGGGQGSQRYVGVFRGLRALEYESGRLGGQFYSKDLLSIFPTSVLVSPSSVDVGPVAAHHLHVKQTASAFSRVPWLRRYEEGRRLYILPYVFMCLCGDELFLRATNKLVSQCLDWVLVPLLMQKSRKQRSHLLTLCFFLHHLHQIQRRDGRRATLSPAQLFGGRGKALGWEGPRQFQGESQGLAHAEGVDNPPRRM